MSQYIVYLRYMGQYLRDAVRQIFHGSFSLPSYDFSIGMGDDIGQVVRFHPLDFLSVFVPASYTEILYEFILILRFYLAGLSFSVFAFSWNHMPSSSSCKEAGDAPSVLKISAANVLSGAMVYVFCGFMLIRVVNHPIYAAPFIVLPMLLLGAERAMHSQGYALFVFSVFLGFWSNYYFMYIMTAGMVIYILVRFPEVYRLNRVKHFFCLLIRMAGAYLLGLAMSMITLYPMIQRYLSSARMPQQTKLENLLFYADKRRYAAWFLNLITPFQSSGNGTDLNYAVIVLPCIVLLFSTPRKKLRSLKFMIISCILILLIPAAGYVLAFFNKENNRWIFLLSMCCAMAVVFTADLFADLTRRQILLMLFVSGCFFALTVMQTLVMGRNLYVLTAAAELVICLAVLLSPWVQKRGVVAVRRCVLLITCVSTVINGYMTYEPGFGSLTEDYISAGETAPIYENVFRTRGASLIEDDSFYRVEGYNMKHGRENSSIFSDYNSTSEYNSILNAGMLDAMMGQNNKELTAITTMKGLDARPVAMNLAHVKYFITKPSYSACVPYGFSRNPSCSHKNTAVYECSKPLAFGYSYDQFITRENYDRLSELEREMVQLEAVVVDSAGKGGADPADLARSAGLQEIEKPTVQIESENVQLPAEGEGAVFENGVVHSEGNGKLAFTWSERAGCDAYLLLSGVTPPKEIGYLTLRTKEFKTVINVRSESQLYYIGRNDYLVHLGYSDTDALQEASLTFRRKGDHQISGASVLYVPMDGYEEKIDSLNEQSMENESVTDGRISGTIQLSSPKILVLSVPAAPGWTVQVDGEAVSGAAKKEEKTSTFTANVMYQGILLPEGDHTIEMTYSTPGSFLGYAVAIPAIVIYLLLLVIERRRHKKKVLPAG